MPHAHVVERFLLTVEAEIVCVETGPAYHKLAPPLALHVVRHLGGRYFQHVQVLILKLDNCGEVLGNYDVFDVLHTRLAFVIA